MIHQRRRKVGLILVVTIPREDVERLGLEEGQLLENQATPLEVRPAMSRPVREALERSWARSERAYRYLAER